MAECSFVRKQLPFRIEKNGPIPSLVWFGMSLVNGKEKPTRYAMDVGNGVEGSNPMVHYIVTMMEMFKELEGSVEGLQKEIDRLALENGQLQARLKSSEASNEQLRRTAKKG